MSKEEDYYEKRYTALIKALKTLPVLPEPLVLSILSRTGEFSKDWNEGKRIQREYGTGAVPPVCECEIGAGYWHRVIQPVPPKGK